MSPVNDNNKVDKGTHIVKKALPQMLKGGVIMDVVNAEQAKTPTVKLKIYQPHANF